MKHLTNIIDIEQTITDPPTDDGLFPEDALADAEEPGAEILNNTGTIVIN